MFNLLGLDWGSKFIGIALADTQTGLVIPHSFVETRSFFVELDLLIAKYKIQKIIVGRPVNFQLQPTAITEKVELFATKLQNKYTHIEVLLFNERNTSKVNIPVLESKKPSIKLLAENSIHALSAKTILEYYLG
jgi:putative holliday junction resolvase